MKVTLAKTYVILSGFILVVVGIVGFFRHEMFNLTFPPAHNVFHLLSGVIALFAGFRRGLRGTQLFGLTFGAVYTILTIAGFLGLRDLGSTQLSPPKSRADRLTVSLAAILAALGDCF